MSIRQKPGFTCPFRRHYKLIIGFLLAVSGIWLYVNHREHLFSVFPYLIILACPLMHLLMHRHGGHCSHEEHSDNST